MSIAPGSTITKDPNSSLAYEWNWSDWLVGAATIAASDFEIDVAPDNSLTLSGESIADGSTSTRVVFTGGTLGKKYRVRNRVTTNETPAQIDDRSIWVRIGSQ